MTGNYELVLLLRDVSNKLLETLASDVDAIIVQVLELIGGSFSCSECSVYVNRRDAESGSVVRRRLYTWLKDANNVALNTGGTYPYNINVLNALREHKTFFIDKSKVDTDVAQGFTSGDLNSGYLSPIFLENELWGYLGIYGKDMQGKIGAFEESVLNTLGILLANAICKESAYSSLMENARRFNDISKYCEQIFLELDLGMRIVYISDYVKDVTGREVSSYLSKHIFDMLIVDDKEVAMEAIATFINSDDRQISFQACLDGGDERVFYVKVFLTQSFNIHNEVIGLRGVVIDISEEQRLYRKIEDMFIMQKRLTDAANKANRTKSQLLMNMSHELVTPLNSIIGFTHIIKKSATDMSPKTAHYLENIYLSANNLLSLFNELLSFSKIEVGKMVLNTEVFRIRDCISQSIGAFVTKIEEKGLKIITVYDNTIPEMLLGDVGKLSHILRNILDNAVKFTKKGRIIVEVISEGVDGEKITISFTVKDTGIGISEDKRTDIFTSMMQGDNSLTREYGGIGIGLSTANGLVKFMGGEMSMDSGAGKGSTFTVTLPFKIADTTQSIKSAKKVLTLDSILKEARILLVEDNELNIEVMLTLLDDYGINIDVARNGQEAIDAVKNKDYDIVFMDIQMPVMDGLEAARKIRDELGKKDLIIIALTAHIRQENIQKSLAAGMNDHINKPVKPDEFIAAVEKWYIKIRDKEIKG